jgi:hypothetical protein
MALQLLHPKMFPAVEPCGATVDEFGAETIV